MALIAVWHFLWLKVSMPGTPGYGWHEGNRGEYLAQYFLSALGVSAPVIRQEDIGIDFYCALANEEERKLTFHSPYIVQHGAVSKIFVYGGYRKEQWRKSELDWLFSQELPLFVCTTDHTKTRFRLYSTSAMWLLRYKFGNEMAHPVSWEFTIMDGQRNVDLGLNPAQSILRQPW